MCVSLTSLSTCGWLLFGVMDEIVEYQQAQSQRTSAHLTASALKKDTLHTATDWLRRSSSVYLVWSQLSHSVFPYS